MFHWAKNSSGHFLEPNTYEKSFTCLKGPACTMRHVKVDLYPAAGWLAECFFLSHCGTDALLSIRDSEGQEEKEGKRQEKKNESQRGCPICLSSWISQENLTTFPNTAFNNGWISMETKETSAYSVALTPSALLMLSNVLLVQWGFNERSFFCFLFLFFWQISWCQDDTPRFTDRL